LTTQPAARTAEPSGPQLALDFEMPAPTDVEVRAWPPTIVPPAAAYRVRAPLVVDRRVLGTLEAECERQPTEEERATLEVCANAMAVLAQATLEPHHAENGAATRFLGDASVAIGFEQNVRDALGTAARLLVPYFADATTIDSVVGVDALERVAESAWADAPGPVDGLPALVRQVAREHSGGLLRTPGGASCLAVPLVRRDVLLGVLACTVGPRRSYGEDDLQFASAYARHVAAAIVPGRAPAPEHGWRPNDALLAILSHELRTPVTAVLGWTRLLQTGHLTGAMTQRALEAIHRSAETQARLVFDMFDLSRILMGTYRLHLAPLDIAGVVERAVEAVEPVASTRSIALRVNLSHNGAHMTGDELRLQQAFTNLLSNSIKYTPAGGHIAITLAADDDHTQVVVTDSGIGIEADFLTHLFEPLQRTESGDPAHHGIGLGLALVKRIVELHGGTVGVMSEGTGKGATFTVRLPRQQVGHRAVRSPAVESGARADPALLENLRLVVVSDDRATGDQLRGALEAHGATVDVVASAAEGVRVARAASPDLVISDLGRTEREELLRGLGQARSDAVPALAISGYGRGDDHMQFLAAGFQLHLNRPVRADELARAVAMLVKRRT
jgi:CheY-like chemotaxis protein